jgi:hypothetical protein
MLTQVIPSLMQAMGGNMPLAAVRQLAQTLGNCDQPLQHRGPVSVAPTPARTALRAGGRAGTYGEGGVFGDEAPWNTTNVFRENFSTLHNNFVYNNYQNQFLNETLFQTTIDARAFSSIFQTNDIYNNNSFVDASATNNHFGGDSFLFNNNVEFITNTFPVEVSFGVPGAPGPPGPSGFDGLPGTNGLAGRDGQPGRAGLDGRDGIAGSDGFDGAVFLLGRRGRAGRAGRDSAAGPSGPPGSLGEPLAPGVGGIGGRGGDLALNLLFANLFFGGGGGFFGVPGRPGRDGRAGRHGRPGPRGRPGAAPKITAKPITLTVPVPTYTFDTENCSVDPSGTAEVEVSAPVEIVIG